MIIHSPIISGSLTFADGSTFTLPDGGNYSGSFSGSLTGNVNGIDILDVKTDVDAILSGSSADKNSFSEIVTLINSIDTDNDAAFASHYTSSRARLSSLENETGSIGSRVDDLESFSSSLSTDYNDLVNVPSGIISSSEQLAADFLDTLGDNVVSSSAQIDLTQTTNYADGIKLKLDAENVFSSSAQVTITESQISDLVHYTDSDVKTKLNTEDVISGSSSEVKSFLSITSSDISDVEAFSQSGNYSGLRAQATTAGDVGLGNVTNESKSTMFASPTFTGTVSGVTKSHVDLGNVDNTSDADKPISTATQTALNGKVGTTSAQALGTAANVLTLSGNTLTLARGDSSTDTIDLSAYLDEDSRSISSGTLNSVSGVVTFTRDDASTFTLDLSDLLDDTNLVTSVAGRNGVVVLTKSDVGLGNVENTTLSTYTGNGGALDNQYITNGAGYITSFTDTQLSNEQVQDIVGGMVSGNTESGITVTYQDDDGTIDFSVASQTDNNFTNALKTKLDGIATAAEVNTVDSVAGKTGVVTLVKGDVGLGNVDNTSDDGKPVSTAQQTALNTKLNINGDNVVSGSSQVSYPNLSNIPSGIISGSSQISISSANISDVDAFSQSGTYANLRAQATTAGDVGLGNVTNESKTTMFSSPTFTGTVSGVTKSHVGLGNVENTALSTYTGQGGALDNQYITNGAGYITSFTNTNQLTTFQVEDGDGTEVTISHGKEWKFVEGTGIDINWTDTSNGSDGDPYDLTITNTAPFTGDVFDNDGTFASLRAQGTTAGDVGLGNVTNESKATMFASPTFTGTVSGVTKTHVGLGNVDNTSDANKPVSTATQTALNGKLDTTHDFSITLTGDVTGTGTVTNMGNVSFSTTVGDDSHNHTIANVDGLQDALNLKANLASPTFTGTVIAPTPPDNDDSTKVATTAFVMREVNDLLGGAPAAFDTLLEISASIANGDSDVVALTTVVGGKLQKDQNLSDLTNATTARTNLGLGSLATLSTVNAATITDNSVGASELNVTGNGTTAQFLRSDGDGTFTWDTPTDTNTTYSVGDGGLTQNNFTNALKTKLDGIEENADVTDSTNVSNAGALMKSGGTMTGDINFNTTGEGITWSMNTDGAYIKFYNTSDGDSNSRLEYGTTDNGDEYHRWMVSTNERMNLKDSGLTVTGGITATGDVVAYASSDRRLKNNIVNIENPIEKVQKLNGVTWDWNGNADELQQSLPNVGVIAQEVEEVFPQLVHDRENGYKGVDYAKLTGLLIEAVKEQQKQIDELKSRLG